jgi:hypothetical protein
MWAKHLQKIYARSADKKKAACAAFIVFNRQAEKS